ncbi:hypothetical protein N7474_004587 [Penicillium riverlandense]|uniref:uncharacterized protein n=1 Tax=Penicillium riverlandense TaxID=1903569 RepID=UPI0025474631|nr:uncharacterized protein N7474_004587 [Penicillium riverlandense]KAJ5818996.1 hypothetical protein N7474_004587 [Penicillium riverlandense]
MEAAEPLSQEEVDEFIAAIDTNHDGFIEYNEVESMLDKVHHEITAYPTPHHLYHDSRDDIDRHQFLRRIISTESDRISSAEFAHIVHRWRIPSLEPDKKDEEANKTFVNSMPLWRRLRAFWSVRGPEVMFVLFVTSITVAITVWKMVIYIAEPQWRRALGWGVVLSRSSAGACKQSI